MTDKDDKKPKPDEAETQDTESTEAVDASKEDAGAASGSPTREGEVVEVVAAGGAVPVTEVDVGMTGDADAAEAGDERAETETGTDRGPTGAAGAAPPPPPAAAQPRMRADGGARFLALVAILLALGVGATTILPQINGGAADRIAVLKTEVATLADQNRALAAQLADMPAATATESVDLSGVEGRLDALEATLADIASIQDRLAALEAGAGSSAAPSAVSEADLAALRDEVAALAATVASFRTGSAGATVSAPVGSSSADTDALASELGDLEQRLNAIEEGAGDAGTAARDLRAGLDGLRDRMAVLASETDALSSRIDAVAETAASQRGQADAEAAQKAALVLALGRLRDVAATGAAFPGAWNSVVELGVDPTEYAVIADAAQHGVPTADALRQRFPAAADAALTAERIGGDDTWYGAAFQRLGNLVSVRRVGEVEGTSVEAIVTRAEYRLQEGNLEAALGELDSLSGPPAEAVASWRAAAESRLKLEQAIRTLQQGIFQNMSQGN